MKNKAIISIAIFVIISLVATICFADDNTVNLKDQINNSLNKTENTTQNIVNDAKQAGNEVMQGAKDAGNMVKDGFDKTGNMINNTVQSGYNTTRTSVGEAYNNDGFMSSTTWMWVIVGVASVIIIAAIWYYAIQESNTHSNDD